MDLVLLSGCGLLGVLLTTMGYLVHAEVRHARRALHQRPPHQPYTYGHTRGYARWAAARRGHGHGSCEPHLHARRGRLRPGVGSRAPRRELPPKPPTPPPPADPWAPFTVGPATCRDDLHRQYRALARAHHPDRGGDPQTMARINLLYAQLVDSRQSSVIAAGTRVSDGTLPHVLSHFAY